MVLGAIERNDDEHESHHTDNNDADLAHSSNESMSDGDDFLAGFDGIEIPDFGDAPQGNEDNFTIDLPDSPENITDAIRGVEPEKSAIASEFENELSKEDFLKTLQIAVSNGLDPAIADQISNFCSNGMQVKDGLLIAGYAMTGLVGRQVSQLCMMSLAGKPAQEISKFADDMLGEPQEGAVSTATSGASTGNGAAEESRSGSGLLYRMGVGLVRGVARGITNIPPMVKDGLAGNVKTAEQSIDYVSQLKSQLSDLEEDIKDYKNLDDLAKKQSLLDIQKSMGVFEGSAKSALGASKSPEEASSIMDVIKGAKKSILAESKICFSDEEHNGMKEFFKKLDSNLKKMYNLIKSKFTADEKLDELSSPSADKQKSESLSLS